MSIITFQGSPTSWGQQGSAYGSTGWAYDGNNPTSSIPLGAGTYWIIWQLRTSGIASGQALNGLRIFGGNDFTVGGGGGTRTRIATLYASARKTYSFVGTGGSTVGTLPGTGAGANTDYVMSMSGFTTDDLLAGNLYVGMAVSTNSADSGLGNGIYRLGSRTFTVYTPPDIPQPPGTTVVTTLVNPTGNTLPGKFPGQQFAALTYTLWQPQPQASYQMAFSIGNGFTFASNGSSLLTLNKGTVNDPASPYIGSTGLINMPAGIKPGSYPIFASINGITGGAGSAVAQLVVAARRAGFFFEV
jgi:hypothetical protein